ncbi:hypothetical protein AB0F81_13750 [Actinoplanes sp. NPDC024001]|uniref:hypothetical protein n=1 Tax=Actinoplanes sp. NPDC024001 TaxID=3154598 RepID=UPI0033FDF262
MFSAFIALVLATLIYSVLAGDTEDEALPRAATLEMIDGLIFGLAVVSLLQGIYLVMRSANIDVSTVKVARFMAVVVFPSMAIYFVAQGASDTVALRAAAAGKGCVPQIPTLGFALTAASAVILALSLTAPAQRVLAAHRTASGTAAPILVISASIAGAMVAGEISTYSPDFLMSPFYLNVYLSGVAVILTTVGLMFSASGVAHPDNDPHGANAAVGRTLTAEEITQELSVIRARQSDADRHSWESR